jgi:hypothetical protein
LCLSKNLVGISPSPSESSRPSWRRPGPGPGMQEVSHRGREIAGLGVWVATVTISLQDGCGFADRESAAWTCQRCRSEVSTGEPGPPRPCRSIQGPTKTWHLFLISCPSPQEGDDGLDLPPGLTSPHAEWTQDKAGREKLQGPGQRAKH